MKKLLISLLISLLLLSSLILPVYADAGCLYVKDLADVLTDAEEISLNENISAFCDRFHMDMVILTTKGVSSGKRMSYADDYYDYNGYGDNGLLLLVNINDDGTYSTRNSWVSTCGKAINLFNDSTIQDIGQAITPYLLQGEYYAAFDTFVDQAGSSAAANIVKGCSIVLGIAAIIGIIAATVYVSKLKKDLITVKAAREAGNYLVPGSLDLIGSYDHFLYSTIHKTEIKSSSGGSHRSSSGRSHGGSGF